MKLIINSNEPLIVENEHGEVLYNYIPHNEFVTEEEFDNILKKVIKETREYLKTKQSDKNVRLHKGETVFPLDRTTGINEDKFPIT